MQVFRLLWSKRPLLRQLLPQGRRFPLKAKAACLPPCVRLRAGGRTVEVLLHLDPSQGCRRPQMNLSDWASHLVLDGRGSRDIREPQALKKLEGAQTEVKIHGESRRKFMEEANSTVIHLEP